MIETKEQYELFKRTVEDITDPRNTELVVSTEDAVETIEALRRVARAAPKLLELIERLFPEVDWGDSHLSADTIRLLNEAPGRAKAALAHIEQNAPWLLEGNPDESA